MSNSIKRLAPKTPTPTRVIFMARLSYVHLTEPWSAKDGNEKKYSVSCIIPKEDTATVAAIEAAIEAALKEGVVKLWQGKRPNTKSNSFRYPLKDGDKERPDDEAYKNTMFIGANAKPNNRPVTLNRLREPVEPGEIYSGCYALVSVNFFPFDSGSKGVGCGLNAVLKYADGEKLGGGHNSANDFDVYGEDLEPEIDDLDDM